MAKAQKTYTAKEVARLLEAQKSKTSVVADNDTPMVRLQRADFGAIDGKMILAIGGVGEGRRYKAKIFVADDASDCDRVIANLEEAIKLLKGRKSSL